MQECVSLVRTMLTKEVTIRMVCALDMPLADTDKRRLKQAALNLLSNAAKFSLIGEIVLNVEVVDDDLVIIVSDSGPGIEETMRARLFVPFESIGRDGEKLREGTGIGLSLTRHLCNLLGGDVDIHSEGEEGAMFIIRVPMHLEHDRMQHSPQISRAEVTDDELEQQFAHAGAANKSTVLLIDDDATMYDLARRFSPSDDIRILWALSPDEGLALAQEGKPDLISLDIFMPGPVGLGCPGAAERRPTHTRHPCGGDLVCPGAFSGSESRSAGVHLKAPLAQPVERAANF